MVPVNLKLFDIIVSETGMARIYSSRRIAAGYSMLILTVFLTRYAPKSRIHTKKPKQGSTDFSQGIDIR